MENINGKVPSRFDWSPSKKLSTFLVATRHDCSSTGDEQNQKKIKMGRDYWRSLAQIPTHSRVNAKAVSGCSWPCSGKSCTSPRVLLSGYVRKSEGVSTASTGNENPDLHPVYISFIRSLALVILLRGER